MAEGFPFIGREAEMARIEKALFEEGSTQILFIYSENGGIGKTRVLQEIYARYNSPEYDYKKLNVVPIIDFDDRAVNSRGTLQRKMVAELGDDQFTSYLRKMIDWRKLEEAGVSMQRLEEESTRVRLEFEECLNRITREKRVVFLLDTTDKVEGKEIWIFLREVLAGTKNIVLIIAGRNTREIFEENFQAITSSFRQTLIPISPFSSSESDNYLQVKLDRIKQAYNAETIIKIKMLSRGIPILFDLSLERLAQDHQFEKFLSQKSNQYLENLSKEDRRESERIMVSYLADQRSDLSELVLLLAHVYPANRSMIQELLRLEDDQKVDRLIKAALSTVYIKQLPGERISLHDEMRRMVNEHVWPAYDPEDNQKTRYSQKAVEFFERDIKFLQDRVHENKPSSLQASIEFDNLMRRLDSAQLEYLRHLLITDTKKALDYYLATVDEARRSHRLRFAQKMGIQLRDIEPTLTGEYRYKVELSRIKQMIDSGHQKAAEAKAALLALREKFPQPEYTLDILNQIGVCETLLGEYPQALAHEEEVLGGLTNIDAIINVSNYIGYIYRLQGDWRSATEYYKKALSIARKSATVSPNTVATIYNNLAYVICLLGNYVEAREYCKEAIRIWEAKGMESAAARGYLTRAIIYRDRGSYDEALTYFRNAIKVFKKGEEPDDNKHLASAYFEYAWSLWFQGDLAAYKNHMDEAKQFYILSKNNFDSAKELAWNYDLVNLMPSISKQMSNVYWRLGLKDEARRLLQEGYTLGKKYNDIKNQVDCILGFAEFDIEEGHFDQINSYATELADNYENQGYEFPLFYGRMKRILAEVAISKNDFETAKKLYAAGLAQISEHGGYGMYFLDRELDRVKMLMIQHLSRETTLEWLDFFTTYWQEHASHEESKSGKLLSWCDTFISQTMF